MEISRKYKDPVTLLRDGIEEFSGLVTIDEVLQQALKISLSLTGSYSGHVMYRTGEDMWQMDLEGNVYISPATIGQLTAETGFSADSDLKRFLNDEMGLNIRKIVPIRIENTLVAALLLKDSPDTMPEPLLETCLSLLNKYVSVLIAAMKISKEMQEMKVHYEDIIVKKETAEKLASLGTIAAGLAHEIKNPLVSIKTLAQLLPDRFDDPEFRDYFSNIAINEVDRIGSIVSDLLDFAKSSEPKVGYFDLIMLLEDTIKMLSSQFTGKGIVVQTRFAKHIPLIEGDMFQIKQVLLNIFINGIEAMPGGGELTVEASRGDDIVKGEMVIIKIADTGIGISTEDKLHLFEPFFTTKSSGTGLGLSICKRILEKHDGEIFIDSVDQRETIVTLMLPVKYRSEGNDPMNPPLLKGGS